MSTSSPGEPHRVREGSLHGGLPYLAVGEGQPLIVLVGLSAEHTNPTGLDRWMQLRLVRPLAERFAVHLVGRRPGLPAGTTIGDLAGDVATAIATELDGPTAVYGVSTGGSIALQLAIDHPEVVDRLVLASSACRLSDAGREAQRRLADLTASGRPRQAWAALGDVTAGSRIGGYIMTGLMWLGGPASDPDDPSDMLATIRAEDSFDVSGELHRITAPTLVVAGGRDGFYSPDLFRQTAGGIAGAELRLYPRKGHAGVLAHRPAQRETLEFLGRAGR
jgi:pimeloyl-ACP methyl ester carboxylesterase